MAALLQGQCLCRAATYEVEDDFAYAVNCHCSNCRRATGAAFKPLAGIRIEGIKVVRGHETLMRHGADAAHDLHCQLCGSLFYSMVRKGAWAHVAMGTPVDAPSITPSSQTFVGSKAAWFQITDNLPQHLEFN